MISIYTVGALMLLSSVGTLGGEVKGGMEGEEIEGGMKRIRGQDGRKREKEKRKEFTDKNRKNNSVVYISGRYSARTTLRTVCS